jgi:hypothetical protein
MLHTEYLPLIERGVDAILQVYQLEAPPVPVEIMLQRPHNDLWEAADPSELSQATSAQFSRYGLRMSVARLLSRTIANSQWGQDQGLAVLSDEREPIRAFARALLMPRVMIEQIAPGVRTPTLIAMRFQVPEEDAKLRLLDLGHIDS